MTSLGGELVRTFGGSRGFIQELFGTADGSMIVAKGGDRSVTVFDVETGVRLGTPLTIADDAGDFVALSPSGSHLAISSTGGVLVWDLDPDTWVAAACRVAGRNLTRAEWSTNIGDLAPFGATCPEFPSS